MRVASCEASNPLPASHLAKRKLLRLCGAADTAVRRRPCQARERSLGEIPGKASARRPWKGETQGSIRRSAC